MIFFKSCLVVREKAINKGLYKIRKKNYLSKDYNVELRCEKIIQIMGCEKFEMIDRIIRKMIVDHDLIGSLFLH